MSGVRWARVARAFRRVALPLASYYGVTLALPLANGATPSRAFMEHALVVLVVPPIAIMLGCAVHAIAPHSHGYGTRRSDAASFPSAPGVLLKYPGLTIAGGLALAIAIGIGAGWYDLFGKLLWPTIPLPDGDRIVTIETQNALTSQPELRVTRDFLEWRSDVRSIDGAIRTVGGPRFRSLDSLAPAPVKQE